MLVRVVLFLLTGCICFAANASVEGYIDPATIALPTATTSPQVSMIDSRALSENLKKMGVTYDIVGDELTIFTDQDTVLASIPTLQSIGAINPAANQAVINAHPVTYSGVTAMFFAALILPNIYQHSSINQIHVTLNLTGPDMFGVVGKHTIMYFDFDRNLFEKINWDKFQPQNLIKVAPNFKLDKWYEAQLNAE